MKGYSIEAAPLSKRLGRGWYCLGPVAQFNDGKPHMVEAFHTKLVVFRTESGEFGALDNFCPHMGASLSEGRVRGESLACPFHDWRWGVDGRCTQIPYARRIPPRARTNSWQLTNLNDVLYIWYDPEGQAPDFEIVPIAEFEAFSPWSATCHRIETIPRELVDNMVDIAHFFYVHGEGVSRAPRYFANRFEGHVAWQFIEGGIAPEQEYDPLQPNAPIEYIIGRRSETVYYGPAHLKGRLVMNVDDDRIEVYIILGQLPITESKFDLQMLITVRERPDLDDAANEIRSARIAESVRAGTLQDVRIWQTKARIDNPLLCDGDGPVYQLRRWYEQFFVDRADIRPEMTDRFELVVDTSYSNEIWKQQAEENLAERAREQAGRQDTMVLFN